MSIQAGEHKRREVGPSQQSLHLHNFPVEKQKYLFREVESESGR